jgi:hypothetical protein
MEWRVHCALGSECCRHVTYCIASTSKLLFQIQKDYKFINITCSHIAFQGEKLTTMLYPPISMVLIIQCIVKFTRIIYNPPFLADSYFSVYIHKTGVDVIYNSIHIWVQGRHRGDHNNNINFRQIVGYENVTQLRILSNDAICDHGENTSRSIIWNFLNK